MFLVTTAFAFYTNIFLNQQASGCFSQSGAKKYINLKYHETNGI